MFLILQQIAGQKSFPLSLHQCTNKKQILELSSPMMLWKQALKSTYRFISCPYLWEMMYKIIFRWYLTSYRLSKTYPNSSPYCWKQCGNTDSLIHMLWYCKSIWSNWNHIIVLTSDFTPSPIHPSPLQYYTSI